jgi:hypothetical protein
MKKFIIEESEKERILNLHKKATLKNYLSEQADGSSLAKLDPNYKAAQTFFKAQHDAKVSAPIYADANLIYVTAPVDNFDNSFGYVIVAYKVEWLRASIETGQQKIVFKVMVPNTKANMNFDISKGFTQVEVLQTAENQNFDFNKSAQECAQSVNDWWAQFPIDTVKIHLTAQKANLKPMADKMKQDKNFAAVIPLLKGNAATAWQLVSV